MAALTREQIDAEHYVARYARGSLSEQEAEDFEEYCLLHPDLVQEVRADRAMRRGLRALGPSTQGVSHAHQWRNYSIAATVLAFALLIGWQFRPAHTPSTALYAATAQSLPASLRAELAGPFAVVRERGSAVQTLTMPVGAVGVELTLEPQLTAGAERFRVTLEEFIDDRLEPRGQIELAPAASSAADGVRVVIDLREVRSSRLRLTLTREDGAADVFELRIEPTR